MAMPTSGSGLLWMAAGLSPTDQMRFRCGTTPAATAWNVHSWFVSLWILAHPPPDGSDVIRLEFDLTHSYGSEVDGIAVPIILRSGNAAAWLTAKIDTGASHCLFERGQGEILDLNIESGERKFFSTVSGHVETFGHLVQIEALGVIVDSMVYFFANEAITKSVLGRSGWLDRIRIGIVDYCALANLSGGNYCDRKMWPRSRVRPHSAFASSQGPSPPCRHSRLTFIRLRAVVDASDEHEIRLVLAEKHAPLSDAQTEVAGASSKRIDVTVPGSCVPQRRFGIGQDDQARADRGRLRGRNSMRRIAACNAGVIRPTERYRPPRPSF